MVATSSAKPRRPIAVTIIGILIFVTALGYLAVGALFVWSEFEGGSGAVTQFLATELSGNLSGDPGLLLAVGIIFAVVGLAHLIFGIGFLALQRWAWVTLITLQAFILLSELITFFGDEEILNSAPIAILLILLLNQSDVRRAFGIIRSRNDSSTNTSLDISNVN